jgi:hypothetical protein
MTDSHIPAVLLRVDTSAKIRVWTLHVDTRAWQLDQPYDLFTALDIATAYLAAEYQIDVYWQRHDTGWSPSSVRHLQPGDTVNNDRGAALLAARGNHADRQS